MHHFEFSANCASIDTHRLPIPRTGQCHTHISHYEWCSTLYSVTEVCPEQYLGNTDPLYHKLSNPTHMYSTSHFELFNPVSVQDGGGVS
jgi:hypothetical protein